MARTVQLTAVAVVPLAAGLTGDLCADPAALADGFQTAMLITAGLTALGGVLAAATIRNPLAGSAEPTRPGGTTAGSTPRR